jgi:rhamnogalacturonyl hydrolase YesR
MSCGQTYAEVYLNSIASGKGANDTFIAHIRDKVLQVLVDRPNIDDWWWDDAYFMAMGAFARIGSIKKDTQFYDKLFALYNDSAVRRGLWSEEDHLYFRDETYKNKTTPHGKHVFWGRGEGWTSGALARTMEYVPKTHASYAIYSSHLQMMAKTLKSVQSADGMWRASVLDPTDPSCTNPETTGTGGMTFGLAWGVNNGVLDKAEYGPVVISAWNGMTKLAVQDSGRLGYCQPIGGGPKASNSSLTSDFCVGLFLLAAEQVAKMAN